MALSYRDIKNRAHQFIIDYEDAVKENAESQSFLNEFFNIFGISRHRIASFENPVKLEDKGVEQLYQKALFNTPLEHVKHLFELYEKLNNS